MDLVLDHKSHITVGKSNELIEVKPTMLVSIEPVTVVVARKFWFYCSFLVNIFHIVAKESYSLFCQINFLSLCDVTFSIVIPENLTLETKIKGFKLNVLLKVPGNDTV